MAFRLAQVLSRMTSDLLTVCLIYQSIAILAFGPMLVVSEGLAFFISLQNPQVVRVQPYRALGRNESELKQYKNSSTGNDSFPAQPLPSP
jgi:hypothetical protein